MAKKKIIHVVDIANATWFAIMSNDDILVGTLCRVSLSL